jgi:hypothetical protein
VPHRLICAQAGRRRHPTLGQAQESITSMRDEDRAKSIARPGAKIVVLPLQPRSDEFRAFQVEIVGARPAVSADVDLHGAHEIHVFNGSLQHFDMSRHESLDNWRLTHRSAEIPDIL